MSGGARRTWLIAHREWNQRVRSLAFRISTAISVLIVVGIVVLPEIFGGNARPTTTVGLVGDVPSALPAVLRTAGDQLDLLVKTRAFDDERAGMAAVRSGDVSVLLVGRRLIWKAEANEELAAVVTSAVGLLDRQETIGELGLDPQQSQRLLAPPRLSSTVLQPTTVERSARIGLASIGLVLLFMAIAFYGGFVLVGVVEEKSSRVVEVMLSRVRPAELLGGKVLGIGLVGLAQFVVVAGSAAIALALSGSSLAPTTTPSTIAWVLFWFVLGYGFYSVMYATAGSLVSRQEEAQTIQFPVVALLFVAYFFSFSTVESPDGTAALIGSFVPPTAPMVMTVRVAHGAVPWWQILLSVALTVGAVYGLVQLAGRIYAGAVLRIGRRVRLKEAWRGGEG